MPEMIILKLPIIAPIAIYLLYRGEILLGVLAGVSLLPFAGLWIASLLIVLLIFNSYFILAGILTAFMIILGLIGGKYEGVAIGSLLVIFLLLKLFIL